MRKNLKISQQICASHFKQFFKLNEIRSWESGDGLNKYTIDCIHDLTVHQVLLL